MWLWCSLFRHEFQHINTLMRPCHTRIQRDVNWQLKDGFANGNPVFALPVLPLTSSLHQWRCPPAIIPPRRLRQPSNFYFGKKFQVIHTEIGRMWSNTRMHTLKFLNKRLVLACNHEYRDNLTFCSMGTQKWSLFEFFWCESKRGGTYT